MRSPVENRGSSRPVENRGIPCRRPEAGQIDQGIGLN
jgi:hypothetical protein